MSDSGSWQPPSGGEENPTASGQQPPPPAAGPQPGGWGQLPPMPPISTYQQAAKPGVVPLRPLSAPEVLDGAVQSIRYNPKLMLGVSGALALLSAIVEGILTIALPDDVVVGDETADISTGAVVPLIIFIVLSYLVQLITTGILAAAVSRAVLGQRITVGEAWAIVRPRIWALLGASLAAVGLVVAGAVVGGVLSAFVPIIGIPLLIVGTVWLAVSLALFAPVVVLEGQGPLAGLARSVRLVRGSWWRTLGVLLLAVIVGMIIGFALQAPFGAIAAAVSDDPTSAANVVISEIGAFLASTLTLPFVSAVLVLVYVDRRIRREALDVELARAAGLGGPEGGAAAPGPAM